MTTKPDASPKTHPVIFSVPMIRALLDGRKTQTRRLIKINESVLRDLNSQHAQNIRCENGAVVCGWLGGRYAPLIFCPYGSPGDLLWCKETGWQPKEPTERDLREGADTWPRYEYDADDLSDSDAEQFKEWGWKRRPSIFMPRWASRLTLELTEVRVERLYDITEDDAVAEGIEPVLTGTGDRCGWLNYGHRGSGSGYYLKAETSYFSLWESLHGNASLSANPWVWVLGFSVHHKNIDALLRERAAA